MKNNVFNTPFENMLRVLLLTDTMKDTAEAVRLSVRNDFLTVVYTQQGFEYKINERGKQIVRKLVSPYAKAYQVGARVVCRKFAGYSDQDLLQYITDKASERGN